MKPTFTDWLARLLEIAPEYANSSADCWVQFYDDDLSPEQAIQDDRAAGV